MLNKIDNIHLVIHSSLFIYWYSFCHRRINQFDPNKYNVDDFSQAEVSVWEIISVFYGYDLSFHQMASIFSVVASRRLNVKFKYYATFHLLEFGRWIGNSTRKLFTYKFLCLYEPLFSYALHRQHRAKTIMLCVGGCIPTFSSGSSAILSLGKGQTTPEED